MDDDSAQEARVRQAIYGHPLRNSVITALASGVLVAPVFLLRDRATPAQRIVPVAVIEVAMGLWCHWLISRGTRWTRRDEGPR